MNGHLESRDPRGRVEMARTNAQKENEVLEYAE